MGRPETEDDPAEVANNGIGEDFEHERVMKLWDARLKYAEACSKENDTDYRHAVNFYRGGEGEWEGLNKEFWDGIQISSNTWARDVNLLASYLLGTDPRTIAKSHKGKELQNTADAVAALANYAYAAAGTRLEITLSMIEALFRNKAYVFQAWDNYRNLPTWRWCSENVYLDPDAQGDMKRAKWIAEKFTMSIEEILDDKNISDEVKKDLKSRTDVHSQTTVPKRAKGSFGSESIDTRVWDAQPGFTKLVCYRVFSRAGVIPRGSEATDGTREGFGDSSSTKEKSSDELETSIHAPVGSLTPGPEPSFDAKPQTVDYNKVDKDRRVFMLLVQGYKKVVKLDTWHMDHFDRDDFPYVRLQFTKLPGDDDGVPIFKLLRPIFRAMNYMLSFATADARDSARRLVGVDKQKVKSAADLEKITSGKHLETYLQDGRGGVEMVEFSARNPRAMELYPVLKEIHDESSGVTDSLRGEAGRVEKTATEAHDLADKAQAGLAMLEDAMETFHNNVARLDVMAIQRYVKKESKYLPCAECSSACEDCEGAGCDECGESGVGRGAGFVPDPMQLPTPQAPSPIKPCPECGADADPSLPPAEMPVGHGWDQAQVDAADPITRGADFYLSDHYVQAWRDDLSLAQVRAEIVVYVQKGSSQKGFQERRVAVLTHTLQTIGPILEKYGGFRSFFAIVKKIMDAADPDDEGLAPTDQEIEELIATAEKILQMTLAKMAPPPPPGPPPPPPPDPVAMQKVQSDAQAKQQSNQIAASKVQGDQQLRQQEIQGKAAESSANAQIELRKVQLDEQRLALEAAGVQQTIKEQQTEIQSLMQRLAALEAAQQATPGPAHTVADGSPKAKLPPAPLAME